MSGRHVVERRGPANGGESGCLNSSIASPILRRVSGFWVFGPIQTKFDESCWMRNKCPDHSGLDIWDVLEIRIGDALKSRGEHVE